jgi:REP element-mobilizing transposase RayT
MDDDGERTHSHWPQHRLPGFDYATNEHAFFVTICAWPDTSPFEDPSLAQSVVASLDWLRSQRQVTIYAYCLMPDHLHLLLQLGS